jgi:lysozyme family protein
VGSTNFLLAVDRVLSHEGNYSNNPSDPGGETMFGITLRTARKHGYSGEMRFLPRAEAIRIYEEEYWTSIRGDELPFPLAFQLFDFCVNSGPVQAVKLLQRALGLVEDGVFGPETLKYALADKPGRAAYELINQRSAFQSRLPTWPAFGKGWTARNFANIGYLLKDLGVF